MRGGGFELKSNGDSADARGDGRRDSPRPQQRDYITFPGTEAAALYAPTRAGKGVGYVIPNRLLWPHTLVRLDVMRENYEATADGRTARRRAERFQLQPVSHL